MFGRATITLGIGPHSSSFYLFFFPRLISAVADWYVYYTFTHGVALVQSWNAGLKRAACGSLAMQDGKNRQKVAICAPSYNFVGLYLRN